MYDVINANSYRNLANWYKEVRDQSTKPMVLVGNKCEVAARRVKPKAVTFHRKIVGWYICTIDKDQECGEWRQQNKTIRTTGLVLLQIWWNIWRPFRLIILNLAQITIYFVQNLQYYEVSTKLLYNIEKPFLYLIRKLTG